MRGLSIDAATLPQPHSEDEYRIHMSYFDLLSSYSVPIKNRKSMIAPLASDRRAVSSLMHVAQTLQQVSQVVRDNVVPAHGSGQQNNFMQFPGASMARPRQEKAYQDKDRNDISVASNVLERHEECLLPDGDPDYTCGAAVNGMYLQGLRLDLMFAAELDVYKPEYTVCSFRPSRENDKLLDKEMGFFKKVCPEQHPILMGYSEHVQDLLKDSQPVEDAAMAKGGVSIYVSYLCRFLLCVMRAQQRFGETINMDDCFFSYRLFNPFFKALRKKKVSVSVRVNFLKSLIHFKKYLAMILQPVMSSPVRLSALTAYEAQLRSLFQRARNEDRIASSLKGIISTKTADFELYAVSCGIAFHPKIEKALNDIHKDVANGKTMSIAAYNFFMGATMHTLVQLNTSRNELCYKLLNGGIRGDVLRSGEADPKTGLQKIVMDGETYYVSYFPKPKQCGGQKSRSSVMRGLFVANQEIRNRLLKYAGIKKVRLEKLNKKHMLAPTKSFFLSYAGEPVSFSSVPWYMKSFLRCAGLENRQISCNQARHMTAQMQFDEFVTRTLTGGADKNAAFLAGHSTTVQNDLYTMNDQKKAVLGFIELRRLENKDKQDNFEAVKTAFCSIKIANLYSTTLKDLMYRQENELDDENQLLEDFHESDTEDGPDDQCEIIPATVALSTTDQLAKLIAPRSTSPTAGPSFSVPITPTQGSRTPKRRAVRTENGATDGTMLARNSSATQSEGADADLVEQRRPFKKTCLFPPLSKSDEMSLREETGQARESPHEKAKAMRNKLSAVLGSDDENSSSAAEDTVLRLQSHEVSELNVTKKDESDVSVKDKQNAAYSTATNGNESAGNVFDFEEQGELQEPGATRRYHVEDFQTGCDESENKLNTVKSREDFVELAEALKKHNNTVCEARPFHSIRDNWAEFVRRRSATPVQDWPWVKIGDVRCVNGFGLFAKVDIEKGSIVCDYRGRTTSVEDHLHRLSYVLDDDECERIENYFFQHEVICGTRTLKFGIEGHYSVYNGQAVLGRYINHSEKHANVFPRFYRREIGDTLHVVIYFEALRNIKSSEQLLFHYGKFFKQCDWFHLCPCGRPSCTEKLPPPPATTARCENAVPPMLSEDTQETVDRGPSMSQSLAKSPFVTSVNPTDIDRIVEAAQLSSGCQIALKRTAYGDWKQCICESRRTFRRSDLFDDNFNFGVFHDLLAFLFERWVKKQEVTLLVLKSGLSYVGGIGLLFGDVQTGKMSGILTHDVATSAYFAGVPYNPSERAATLVENQLSKSRVPTVSITEEQMKQFSVNQWNAKQIFACLKE